MKRLLSYKLNDAGRWRERIACGGQDDIVDEAHTSSGDLTRRHCYDAAKPRHNIDKLTTGSAGEEGIQPCLGLRDPSKIAIGGSGRKASVIVLRSGVGDIIARH